MDDLWTQEDKVIIQYVQQNCLISYRCSNLKHWFEKLALQMDQSIEEVTAHWLSIRNQYKQYRWRIKHSTNHTLQPRKFQDGSLSFLDKVIDLEIENEILVETKMPCKNLSDCLLQESQESSSRSIKFKNSNSFVDSIITEMRENQNSNKKNLTFNATTIVTLDMIEDLLKEKADEDETVNFDDPKVVEAIKSFVTKLYAKQNLSKATTATVEGCTLRKLLEKDDKKVKSENKAITNVSKKSDSTEKIKERRSRKRQAVSKPTKKDKSENETITNKSKEPASSENIKNKRPRKSIPVSKLDPQVPQSANLRANHHEKEERIQQFTADISKYQGIRRVLCEKKSMISTSHFFDLISTYIMSEVPLEKQLIVLADFQNVIDEEEIKLSTKQML